MLLPIKETDGFNTMSQGCRLMTHAPQLAAAKEMFTAITKMEPSFAEVSLKPQSQP